MKIIKEENRIEYIDFYRGLGILLMVMGHVYFGGLFDKLIHAFHMPMFFFITGYFYKEDTFLVNFVKKKVRTLLFPYFFFGIFNIIVYCLINHTIYLKKSLDLIGYNTNGWVPIGPLWFLTALFFATIIYKIIDLMYKKSIYKSIMATLIAFLGNVTVSLLHIRLPWALDTAFVAVGFIHIGRLGKIYKDNKIIYKMMNLDFFGWIIFSLLASTFIFLNGYVNMREGVYSNVILFWIAAVSSIVVLLNFSKILQSISKKIALFRIIYKYLSWVGENSVIFLCLNQLIIYIIKTVLPNNLVNILFYKVVVLVVAMISLTFMDRFIIRRKYKVIIGK